MAKAQSEAWGLGYIDLYLIHFPCALKYVDPAVIRFPVRYPFYFILSQTEFTNDRSLGMVDRPAEIDHRNNSRPNSRDLARTRKTRRHRPSPQHRREQLPSSIPLRHLDIRPPPHQCPSNRTPPLPRPTGSRLPSSGERHSGNCLLELRAPKFPRTPSRFLREGERCAAASWV